MYAFLCMLPLHRELFPSPWNDFWLDTYRCVAVFFLVISVTPLIFTRQFSGRAVEIQLCWHSSVLLWLDCKQDPVFCLQSRWREILKIEQQIHAMNDIDLIFGLKWQKSGHCLTEGHFSVNYGPNFFNDGNSNVGGFICWSTTDLCWKQTVICWLGTGYLGSKNRVFRPLVVGHLLLTGGFWDAVHWYSDACHIMCMRNLSCQIMES